MARQREKVTVVGRSCEKWTCNRIEATENRKLKDTTKQTCTHVTPAIINANYIGTMCDSVPYCVAFDAKQDEIGKGITVIRISQADFGQAINPHHSAVCPFCSRHQNSQLVRSGNVPMRWTCYFSIQQRTRRNRHQGNKPTKSTD